MIVRGRHFLALAAILAAPATAAPLRVMSINQCADQLVLALLPPSRIVSVSWLSRDPATSLMAAAAMRVPTNRGSAEEVLRARPDLVIAGSYTTPATRALVRRLGIPLLELGPADDFPAIRAQIIEVARAVGAEARGEQLAAHLDAGVSRLRTDAGPALRVAAWDSAGFAAQPGSLYATLLAAAGARNVATEAGVTPGIETLLMLRPAVLVRGGTGARDTPRGDRDQALIRRLWSGRTVIVPPTATMCGTPYTADAALRLRARLRALPS